MFLKVVPLAVALVWLRAEPSTAGEVTVASAKLDTKEFSPNMGLFRLPAHRGEADALAGPEGFGFLSKNDDFGLMLHWILQNDIRSQFNSVTSDAERLSFLVRYAGLALTVRLYERIRSELLVSFSQNQLNLSEANLDAEATSWLHFKEGKFHYPISMERITTSIFFPLVDASLTSALLPSVDVGGELWGRLAEGTVDYNLGVVNGATAGAPAEIDVDRFKDFVGRIFAKPFSVTRVVAIKDLGIGFGGSVGEHHGTLTNPQLPKLQSWGGRTWFAFQDDGTASGTVRANGVAYRMVPQMSWNARMVSAYAEYARTVDRSVGQAMRAQAWSAVVAVVATGEDSVPLHYVVPRHNLDFREGWFGAVEMVGSAGGLYVDAPASLVSPVAAARRVESYAGGLNWYPAMAVRVMLDVEYTRLFPMPQLASAPDELLFVGRLQLIL